MADSPEHVVELFSDIAQKAKPKAETELKEITKHFNLSDISVWDMSYYGRKLREEKYALDDRELKKYFVYENVLSGMFITIQKLYGIEMKKITRESYHEDVEIYEVYKDGKFLSYFFTDYFYRTLKRQGAWANILRENYAENTKITVNVCNFQRVKGEPTLLTLSDVETMFHEFGHATHEMLSKSKYSELSGFHVEWDFVELPSQLLENWCRDRDGMKLFAKHVDS
jgi:Zn-dependent oligopeptidase